MSDVLVPFGENPGETATLLLAAAEELGLGQSVVRTSDAGFLVPEEVAKKVDEKDEPKPEPKKPEPLAKKAPAKKAAKKK
jgi:hypothetical protein